MKEYIVWLDSQIERIEKQIERFNKEIDSAENFRDVAKISKGMDYAIGLLTAYKMSKESFEIYYGR